MSAGARRENTQAKTNSCSPTLCTSVLCALLEKTRSHEHGEGDPNLAKSKLSLLG